MPTWEEEARSRPAVISDLLGWTRPPRYLRPDKPDTSVPAVPQCLYCLKRDRPFTGQEHIIPQGLGNDHLVLPRGVTCDPCNNGPLSVLDSAFLKFDPVAMMRTFRGVPTKQGALPNALFGNAALWRRCPSDVEITTNSRKAITPIPGGVRLNLIGREVTPPRTAQLVRWMFKATLGCTYIDRGRFLAMSPDFDEVRRIVLGAPFHGYLAMRKSARPHESVQFSHWPVEVGGKATVLAMIDVFGVSMATDLFIRRPTPELDRGVISVVMF